jgi:hypothetical protein
VVLRLTERLGSIARLDSTALRRAAIRRSIAHPIRAAWIRGKASIERPGLIHARLSRAPCPVVIARPTEIRDSIARPDLIELLH